eukprot:1563321-Amphidinium_carterae.6
MGANTGGDGDKVPTPGAADDGSKRAKTETTLEYNQRVSKELNKKQEEIPSWSWSGRRKRSVIQRQYRNKKMIILLTSLRAPRAP